MCDIGGQGVGVEVEVRVKGDFERGVPRSQLTRLGVFLSLALLMAGYIKCGSCLEAKGPSTANEIESVSAQRLIWNN